MCSRLAHHYTMQQFRTQANLPANSACVHCELGEIENYDETYSRYTTNTNASLHAIYLRPRYTHKHSPKQILHTQTHLLIIFSLAIILTRERDVWRLAGLCCFAVCPTNKHSLTLFPICWDLCVCLCVFLCSLLCTYYIYTRLYFM